MLRRVHRELAVAFSGPRALLMQATHPVAFEGFFAHTGALDAPYERLRAHRRGHGHDRVRLARARPTARRGACAPCTSACAASSPSPPAASRPARRSPPTIPSCCCGSWRARGLGARRLPTATSRADRGRARRVLAGLPRRRRPLRPRRDEMPADIEAFDRYMRGMLDGDDLFVTSRRGSSRSRSSCARPCRCTRARARARELHDVGLLPARLRAQYGFSWDPLRALALRGGAEYAKRVLVPLAPERLPAHLRSPSKNPATPGCGRGRFARDRHPNPRKSLGGFPSGSCGARLGPRPPRSGRFFFDGLLKM